MGPADAHRRADWRRVQKLYRQLSDVVDSHNLNDDLAGSLAHAMARTCAAYDGEEELFVRHLLEIICESAPQLGSVEERFRSLYHDHRYTEFTEYQKHGEATRRRPTPFEAAVETCRRLRDVNRLREHLAPVPTGCILGGSASYGRFFNTVGARDNEPSDLDLLLIVLDYDALEEVADALALVAGIRQSDLDAMATRIGHFAAIRRQLGSRRRCIFSQKLRIWPATSPDPFLNDTGINGEYEISIHACSADDIDYMILRDLPRLEKPRRILDYRVDMADRADTQRSFAETVIEHPRVGTEKEVAGGYVLPSQICDLRPARPEKGRRYYPGQHQNLILPEFELRWDLEAHRMYLPLYSFKVKLLERLGIERVERPYEVQTLANSHTRRYAFAPYIHKRRDGE